MENLQRNRHVNLRPKSSPATTDYDPFATSAPPAPAKKKRQYRRCLDLTMPEDDVVLRGLYKLDDRQAKIYEDFARMLAGFDHYDAVWDVWCYYVAVKLTFTANSTKVNILADVLTDSVNLNGLEDFTGTRFDENS